MITEVFIFKMHRPMTGHLIVFTLFITIRFCNTINPAGEKRIIGQSAIVLTDSFVGVCFVGVFSVTVGQCCSF